jgi:protein-tyrosine phosphatase
VIHCTAGKDRTGFASALVLHALGVSEKVIAEDYLLTNQYYRRDPHSAPDLPDDIRQAIGSVDASFLTAGFDAVDAEYGDLESYFRDGLGLGPRERNELTGRYLQA